MMLTIEPLSIKRSDKRRWHRRWIFLRLVTIGGEGTREAKRRVFMIVGKLWARRSHSYNRWLYVEHRPAKREGGAA